MVFDMWNDEDIYSVVWFLWVKHVLAIKIMT